MHFLERELRKSVFQSNWKKWGDMYSIVVLNFADYVLAIPGKILEQEHLPGADSVRLRLTFTGGKSPV